MDNMGGRYKQFDHDEVYLIVCWPSVLFLRFRIGNIRSTIDTDSMGGGMRTEYEGYKWGKARIVSGTTLGKQPRETTRD